MFACERGPLIVQSMRTAKGGLPYKLRGHGKKKMCLLPQKQPHLQEAATVFSDSNATPNKVASIEEQLIVAIYGGKSNEDLDGIRSGEGGIGSSSEVCTNSLAMACDTFSRATANALLQDKFIYFFGDSNVRALYKDLIWLLEDGRLISSGALRSKNETTFAGDNRLTNGSSHNGLNYEEIRVYKKKCHVRFQFITRLFQKDFVDRIKSAQETPDVVFINSCVWDLTRWGANSVYQFKMNLPETLISLQRHWSKARIIWLSTLPPSFKSSGGFLTKEIVFLRNMLPWHALFANKYAAEVADLLNIDVLDFHYNFRFLMNFHTKDGIHWQPTAMRYGTNLLLTHLSLIWNTKLPEVTSLSNNFLYYSSKKNDKKSSKTKK
ncbi:hypothetical protein FQR65_LT07136 [Abscondita terminalis]|nr:hypothetical protein FQR65_LT07136 [Abscondita terminalis]